MYKLDLTSLEKATKSLDEAWVEYQKDVSNRFVRDATIQRFEYTYELAYKMLKRYLEMTEPNAEEVDQMAFHSLIRTGSERGLLSKGWDVWKVYRDARNITSHTYNENKAVQVCSVVPGFLADVNYLFKQLKERVSNL